MLTSVTITDTTFKASAVGPIYMREPNPTEPANYRSSHTTESGEMVDIEIGMYQNAAGRVIIDTVTIAPRIIVTIPTQMLLLKLMVSEQEGGTKS